MKFKFLVSLWFTELTQFNSKVSFIFCLTINNKLNVSAKRSGNEKKSFLMINIYLLSCVYWPYKSVLQPTDEENQDIGDNLAMRINEFNQINLQWIG